MISLKLTISTLPLPRSGRYLPRRLLTVWSTTAPNFVVQRMMAGFRRLDNIREDRRLACSGDGLKLADERHRSAAKRILSAA